MDIVDLSVEVFSDDLLLLLGGGLSESLGRRERREGQQVLLGGLGLWLHCRLCGGDLQGREQVSSGHPPSPVAGV